MPNLANFFKRPIPAQSDEDDNRDSYFRCRPAPKPFWMRVLASAQGADILHQGAILSAYFQNVRLRFPAWLLVGGAFVGGSILGAFIVNQRRNADEIVVAFRGTKITAQDFHHRLETLSGTEALNAMVTEALEVDFARSRKVLPAEWEVEARVQQVSARPEFDRFASAHHYSAADIHAAAVRDLVYEKLFGSSDVTEAEARNYYRQQSDPRNPAAKFYKPETVQIAVIVTATEAKARQALAELSDGKPFAQVAEKYSQDRSAMNGGVFPAVLRGRTRVRTVPGLEERIFRLRIGETTGVEKIMGAWWIIRCMDKTDAATVPFDQVREQCRTGARLAKGRQAGAAQVEADFEAFARDNAPLVLWEPYAPDVSGRKRRLLRGISQP